MQRKDEMKRDRQMKKIKERAKRRDLIYEKYHKKIVGELENC